MVVLEDVGMMSTGANQYLQPDYLSPLPTTLDAKKSPLALLAQTCSQIGADTPSGKLAPPPDKKKTMGGEAAVSPAARPLDRPRASPDAAKHLAFKPYEANVVTRRPSSKSSADGADDRKSEKSSSGSRKTSTPTATAADKSPTERKSVSPASSSGGGASPVIRSGLEVLGHVKDSLGAFKQLAGLPGYPPAACCPPGADPLAHPAFRPPFPPLAGFPAYLGYARVKTPTGGEALMPVCKDPYCAGCQLALHPHAALGACPAGCAQCSTEQHRLAAALAYPPYARPYVCNWIAGEAYCGKRFSSSEELLQHLRAHAADAPSPYGARAFSPLARYHPYKTQLPPFAPAPSLASFYAPYALYGQRLGAAVHH